MALSKAFSGTVIYVSSSNPEGCTAKTHFIAVAAVVLAGLQSQRRYLVENANLESQMVQFGRIKSNNLDTLSKLHMAGYANVDAIAGSDRQEDGFTAARFAPIFHFQFSDRVLFEGELEIETNADGETEIATEYATIDLILNDYMALVAGKFLSPIGQFRQNIHPSWINKLPTAPVGFGHGGAAPLSDLGVQLRGGIPLSGRCAPTMRFLPLTARRCLSMGMVMRLSWKWKPKVFRMPMAILSTVAA